MKGKKRFFIGGLLLTMILAMAVIFAGCGSDEQKTLEGYVNGNADARQEIDELQTDGMTVDIKGNTVTYTYTFPDTYEGSDVDLMKTSLEAAMKEAGEEFTEIADKLEEESGIKEVTIKVVYLNGDGAELYSQEYK